jgi:hypothetical protein
VYSRSCHNYKEGASQLEENAITEISLAKYMQKVYEQCLVMQTW